MPSLVAHVQPRPIAGLALRVVGALERTGGAGLQGHLREAAVEPEAQDAEQLGQMTGCVPEALPPIGADVAVADNQTVIEALEVAGM